MEVSELKEQIFYPPILDGDVARPLPHYSVIRDSPVLTRVLHCVGLSRWERLVSLERDVTTPETSGDQSHSHRQGLGVCGFMKGSSRRRREAKDWTVL